MAMFLWVLVVPDLSEVLLSGASRNMVGMNKMNKVRVGYQ